jgi:hypothetical protein
VARHGSERCAGQSRTALVLLVDMMPAKKPAKKTKSRRRRPPARALQGPRAHRRATTPEALSSPASPFTDIAAAYVDLPGRLLACRTPLQVWVAHVDSGQRLVSAVFTPFFPQTQMVPR